VEKTMRGLIISLGVLAAVLMLPAAGGAEDPRLDIENIDAVLKELILSKMLTLECEVPNIQPRLTKLKRSWSPNSTELKGMFFGDDPAVIMGEQSIESPLWGKGTRTKSGTVIYIADRDNTAPTSIGGGTKPVEVVPTFLDVYSTGFIYASNISHRSVYATDVEITDQHGTVIPPSEIDTDEAFPDTYHTSVSYQYVYEVEEGKQAAVKLIGEMFDELTVGSDFRIGGQTLIQDFGERLFVYRAWPEYVTEYNIYGNTGVILAPDVDPAEVDTESPVLGTQSVAVPVHDVYVHMLLDGDKLLAGLEYFWDDGLEAVGTPRECIHAGTALAGAPPQLLEHYGNEPPLLTVYGISLGFIQDRGDRRTLVPVWLFDAWYSQIVSAQEAGPGEPSPLASAYARDHVSVPVPFAIDALTGELYIL